MTKDEIIKMAKEAGGYSPKKYPEEWRLDDDDLLRFAKLVAEKEREECATMSDWILKEGGGTWGDAIRARGQA